MSIKIEIKKYIEKRPWLWNKTWNFIQFTKVFLPHDPTYYVLTNLVGADSKGLILDIGANTGISALSFAKLLPNYAILCFEPNLLLEPYLNKISSKNKKISYKMVGLGEQYSEATLYTPVYKNIPLHTFSSFMANGIKDVLSKSYSQNILDRIKLKTSKCNVISLDSLCLSPNLIKIDAEGFELQIFQGAKLTLEKYRPSIIFEACHDDIKPIKCFLEDRGYKIYRYLPSINKLLKFDIGEIFLKESGSRNLVAVHSKNKIVESLHYV